MTHDLFRFTIRRALLVVWLATLVPPSSFGALGKTADECRKIYGGPAGNATYDTDPPARIKYYFSWRDIDVRAQLVGRDVKDSRCALVTYTRLWRANQPTQALTEAEIERLLALNANGSTWERVPGGWKRSDNRALAVESRHTNNGVLSNTLSVFAADFYPRDSSPFPELMRNLPKHSAK